MKYRGEENAGQAKRCFRTSTPISGVAHFARIYCNTKMNLDSCNHGIYLGPFHCGRIASREIFLCPLQTLPFLRLCTGLSSKAATSLICSGAGEAHGIRERERGRCFMRQPGGGVCRLRTRIACCMSPEEGSVEQSLSYQARRALLQQTVPQYREASPSQKRTLLDAFVAATGYHRTYARWLLNHAEEVQQTLRRPRPHRVTRAA